KHWSAEKIANTFAPHPQASETTLTWLKESGIGLDRIKHSIGRNWVEFTATVDELEALLDTKYHYFQHKQQGGHRIACDEYGLPSHVQKHVDFIMPIIQLDGLRPVAQVKTATEAPKEITGLTGTTQCDKLITIDCLRAIYNIPVGKYNYPGNQLGIAEWANYLYLSDLKIFLQNYTSPKIPSDVKPEFISIDGGKPANLSVAQAEQVIESALDFQTAYSIIWPQQTRLYQNGDSVNVDSVGTFNIFLDALDGSYCTYQGGYTGPLQCGGAPVSNVISVSYGQMEGSLPRFYQERQCCEWMKLALQGVSVIFASGVANRYDAGYNNACLHAKDGYVDQAGTRFSPSFPANCPYITSVGGNDLLNSSIYGGEKALAYPDGPTSLYSGGAFSSIFARPPWQDWAVSEYLSKYSPKYGESVFNSYGRANPDVSALGRHIATVYLGEVIGASGTSASAPIFASIITLLNEERLRQGKGPIGFLNPIIYKHPEMFNDVIVGANPGCGTDGFPASPGWDPVTGHGTPNYEKMREVFLALK
ncbi:hypothetical protein ACEQ8H_006563, partial [Pleosporales sp. CAS-2024a]